MPRLNLGKPHVDVPKKYIESEPIAGTETSRVSAATVNKATGPRPMIEARTVPLAPGPKQLFYTCEHYDPEDQGVCTCPAMRRTGPLAKLIGGEPACILIAAKPDKTCHHYKRQEGPKQRDLYSMVEEYERTHPEEDVEE